MSQYLHPRLVALGELADLLADAARETAVAAHKHYRAARRKNVGATLRPGPDTPLWNELAKLTAGKIRRYGDKANLARELGVPRQRVHEYLVAKTACPDTERALRLLVWLVDVPKSGNGKVSRIT
ncbi:MAG: hypothetical protein IT582_03325 [Opitutaceae bacterium]|nr:hypothetical protein [Opitutaceae bacterium]